MAKKSVTIHTENHSLKPRPPVVAVLGHVDHGKTTLLDTIRQTHLAEKEPGMITQKIGAYQTEFEVGKEKKRITFIDTPGHEAFAKMRQRGAQITDLAILVVAADDGVMPQTKESIAHLQKTNTPFIVALNKIDLPAANPEKVKRQLADEGVMCEGLGGKVVCQPVSARTGKGIRELLEMILLLAEMEGLKADPHGSLKLAVVESKLDPHRGPVATVIVQNGTLHVGDTVELSGVKSKVRGMFDENGRRLTEAGPGTPAEILGFQVLPAVGEVVQTEPVKEKAAGEQEEAPKLRIILKADVSGSLEAILHALPPDLEIITQGVGEISGSEILLAKTSQAVVLGFNLKPSSAVKKLAETEGVLIKTYDVIYELLTELGEVILAQKTPPEQSEILGRAKIAALFPFNNERVAGCQVIEGRISRGDTVKILRNEVELGRSKIKSLKHLKAEIPKAELGIECGVLISPPLDFQQGDVIISYKF